MQAASSQCIKQVLAWLRIPAKAAVCVCAACMQIGMHFMNPVPIMALVELAKGLHTSQQTFEACKGLAEYLGKQVATSQDRPVSELRKYPQLSRPATPGEMHQAEIETSN